MNFFPASLLVRGRECLVIGDDHEAIEKSARLKKAGALVTVIKPEQFKLSQIQQQFFVVFCPKDWPTMSVSVFKRCRARRILLCAIDQPEYCDVVNVSVFERGDLKIMTSTNGVSPALAKKITVGLLESLKSVPIEKNLSKLKQLRRRLFRKKMDPTQRRAQLIDAVKQVRFTAKMNWPLSKEK